MKILVIGGAGYIGGVTSHLAVEAGHSVTVVDNLSSGHRHNIPGEATLLQLDITAPDVPQRILEETKPDIVMHFAAKIVVPESVKKPLDYFNTNTIATLRLAEAAVKTGVKSYIFSSTAAVYGAPEHTPLTEQDPTNPVNPYGYSKLLSEQLLASYHQTHDLSWAAFRYFNVAGAYHRVGPDYPVTTHIIPTLLEKMEKGEAITICGTDYPTPDGTCVRDYAHVVDIARAHLLAAEATQAGKKLNRPINLGSNKGFSVKEIVETFKKVTDKDIEVIIGDRRAGDPAQLIASYDLANRLLGWRPEHDLESIIRDHHEWYVNLRH